MLKEFARQYSPNIKHACRLTARAVIRLSVTRHQPLAISSSGCAAQLTIILWNTFKGSSEALAP
jgi:hypothetical protein